MTHSPNPTAMSREALTWNPATVKPDVGRKIVCLYDDGSGAALFYTHDYGVIDSDGDEYAALTSDYSLWAYLPDDFELHCELHSEPGEHPMHLPVVRTAPQPPKAGTPSPDALRQALSYLTPHALTKAPVVLQADELRQAVETISAALARPVAEERGDAVGETIRAKAAELRAFAAECEAVGSYNGADEARAEAAAYEDALTMLAAAPKANGVGTGEEGVRAVFDDLLRDRFSRWHYTVGRLSRGQLVDDLLALLPTPSQDKPAALAAKPEEETLTYTHAVGDAGAAYLKSVSLDGQYHLSGIFRWQELFDAMVAAAKPEGEKASAGDEPVLTILEVSEGGGFRPRLPFGKNAVTVRWNLSGKETVEYVSESAMALLDAASRPRAALVDEEAGS